MDKKQWQMPEWMEIYREHLTNTGGNSVESLMNDTKTNGFNNLIRASMIISIESEIALLVRLYKRGLLNKDGDSKTDSQDKSDVAKSKD